MSIDSSSSNGLSSLLHMPFSHARLPLPEIEAEAHENPPMNVAQGFLSSWPRQDVNITQMLGYFNHF